MRSVISLISLSGNIPWPPSITYTRVLKAERTGIVYSDLVQTSQFELAELNGFGGVVYKQSLKVPQAAESYGQLAAAMRLEEAQLKKEMIRR